MSFDQESKSEEKKIFLVVVGGGGGGGGGGGVGGGTFQYVFAYFLCSCSIQNFKFPARVILYF